jgi:hypothetical protein
MKIAVFIVKAALHEKEPLGKIMPRADDIRPYCFVPVKT